MIRFDSTHFGMKESRNGKWVEYSLYLSERRELEEIASSRLDIIQEMKQRLEEMKIQAGGWLSSTDGSYEACLNAMGYYKLQQNIKTLEELSNEN